MPIREKIKTTQRRHLETRGGGIQQDKFGSFEEKKLKNPCIEKMNEITRVQWKN